MSNNASSEAVVSDWAVLGVIAHRLRREILRLCWDRPRSVGELSGILHVNPGTALYHVRRLAAVHLLYLEDTRKKRGVTEKRYRSVGRTVTLRPPPEELTAESLAPLSSLIGKALRAIDPALALERRAPLAGHIAEARIGPAQQRIVADRLARLARYIDNLARDPDGVPMVLAAAFGPQAELSEAAPTRPASSKPSPKKRKRRRK